MFQPHTIAAAIGRDEFNTGRLKRELKNDDSAFKRHSLDLSRFDAAPLIAFTLAKETNYGTETNG